MLKSFFKKKASNELKNPSPIDDNVFTIVCVLVEAALVDNNFGDEEKNIIIKLLQKQYKINKDPGKQWWKNVERAVPRYV